MKAQSGYPTNGPWPGVLRAIDSAPSVDDLVAQRLWPIASYVRAYRGADRDPSEVQQELRRVAHVHAAQRTLRAVVDILGHEVVIFKGLAVAARYPRPELRAFGDIDLLVNDPVAAHAALRSAGFEACGPHEPAHFDGLQHLQPLIHVELGAIPLEIHNHVSWVPWTAPPASEDIIAAARPAPIGVDGVLEPEPSHHSLIVAAHSAADMPLRCIGDLLDFDLLSSESDPAHLVPALEAWRVRRLWSLYRHAADAVLYGSKAPRSMRLWARSMIESRDATVFERHARNWLGPMWTREYADMPRGVVVSAFDDLRPADGETWREKTTRLRAGGRNWRRPLAEHTMVMGGEGSRARHTRRASNDRAFLFNRD